MAIAKATPGIVVGRDESITLRGLVWEQYKTITDALPERAGVRTIFVDGRLTFLSPSRRHDWHAERLGRIVEAVAQGLGITWDDAGHSTYRVEGLGGVEGDKTFYFGEHAVVMRGPVNIDLTTQPPPDLVIEVEFTHPADDAVIVWGRLGVPEVWRFDTEADILRFWHRQDDGSFAASDRSLAFPLLMAKDLIDQLGRAEELGLPDWVASLDGWVRDVLIPRTTQAD